MMYVWIFVGMAAIWIPSAIVTAIALYNAPELREDAETPYFGD